MKEGLEGVKESLQKDVKEAEQYRIEGKHTEVEQILRSRIKFENRSLVTSENITLRFSEIVHGVEQAEDDSSLYVSIAVGILGLTRIWHDATNRMIRDKQLQTTGDDREKIETIYQQAESVYREFERASKIQKTIEGNGINWDLEINQTKGRTAELLGDREQATKYYLDAIKSGQSQLETIEDPIENASTRSAMATNKLRLGIYSKNPYLIATAINDQLLSNKIQFDKQRTKDFALMTIKAALQDIHNWKNPVLRKNVLTSSKILLNIFFNLHLNTTNETTN